MVNKFKIKSLSIKMTTKCFKRKIAVFSLQKYLLINLCNDCFQLHICLYLLYTTIYTQKVTEDFWETS